MSFSFFDGSTVPKVVDSVNFVGDPQRNPPPLQYPDTLGTETRRSDVTKIQETFVKVTRISGWIKVAGVGETSVQVDFPMSFIERPAFSQGYELDESSPPETGNFPTYNVTVLSWTKATAGQIGVYWVGALLSIVISGSADQIGWIHWQMEGKAMIDLGTSVSGGVDGTI